MYLRVCSRAAEPGGPGTDGHELTQMLPGAAESNAGAAACPNADAAASTTINAEHAEIAEKALLCDAQRVLRSTVMPHGRLSRGT